MVFPGLWPGAAALFSGGEGHGRSERRWFSAIRDCLYVVTTGSGPVARRREVHMLFPNRRDRQVAARAGILRSLSTGQAMNRLYLYKREKVFI